MIKSARRGVCVTVFIIALAYSVLAGQAGAKESAIKLDTTTPQKISLMAGKSLVIESPMAVKRVSLAAPALADAIILSTRQIYLTGKAAGMTNLTLWENDDNFTTFDLEVYPDMVRLKEKLHEILPQEENIKVSYSHDSIILSNTISNAANLSRALAVAEPFGKVVNLLEVGGVQQVMLEVRVSEVQRSTMKKLGINFGGVGASGKQFGVSLLGNLTSIGREFPAGSEAIRGRPGKFQCDLECERHLPVPA